MGHVDLTPRDCETCLRLLCLLEGAVHSPEQLVRACVEHLCELVPDSQVRFVNGTVGTGPGGGANDDALHLLLSEQPPDHARLVIARPGVRFTPRERGRVALIAPHVAFLYAQACQNARRAPTWMMQGVTPREQEVLRWVSCGKTDADIAALLAISPRTVHKHLEHIYVKLGVETRTAAVMRARRLD
jgi:DNA-binding CsgD family transcriptional regulator